MNKLWTLANNSISDLVQIDTKLIFTEEFKDELRSVEKKFRRQMKKKMWINGGKKR